MIKIRITVLNQSQLPMETLTVNVNKDRMFAKIRNKVDLPLTLTKVFRSENLLHQIHQLLRPKVFAAKCPGKTSQQLFKP